MVIPHLILEPEKELRLEGAALVRHDTLVRWADRTWLSGYYWAVGGSEIMTLTDEAGPIVVELEKKPCKWEIISETPLTIKANMRAVIKIISGYDSWKDSAEADNVIRRIQAQVESQSLECIQYTITQAQQDGTDTFHLGRWLYAWHPNFVDSNAWPTQFATLPIVLEMKTSIEVK